jgi:NAD+ kinase
VVRRIGIILRRDKPEAVALAHDLAPWLTGHGHEIFVPLEPEEDSHGLSGARSVPEATLAQHIDLLVVLGGDGTLLSAGALVADAGVPVLGINLGRLGFLAPFEPSTARKVISRAIAGELHIEERMRLRVTLSRNQALVAERFALNDAVISQGSMARLIELELGLDGAPVAGYRADGLIVCTPTGSTAYNLAAGGPILPPWQEAFVINPICPHTLTHRPLVVPSRSMISVAVPGVPRGTQLTVDGQWAIPLEHGDRVDIGKAHTSLKLFRGEMGYFEILRQKLKWGEQ